MESSSGYGNDSSEIGPSRRGLGKIDRFILSQVIACEPLAPGRISFFELFWLLQPVLIVVPGRQRKTIPRASKRWKPRAKAPMTYQPRLRRMVNVRESSGFRMKVKQLSQSKNKFDPNVGPLADSYVDEMGVSPEKTRDVPTCTMPITKYGTTVRIAVLRLKSFLPPTKRSNDFSESKRPRPGLIAQQSRWRPAKLFRTADYEQVGERPLFFENAKMTI